MFCHTIWNLAFINKLQLLLRIIMAVGIFWLLVLYLFASSKMKKFNSAAWQNTSPLHGGNSYTWVMTGLGLIRPSSWWATSVDFHDRCPASAANQQADTYAGYISGILSICLLAHPERYSDYSAAWKGLMRQYSLYFSSQEEVVKKNCTVHISRYSHRTCCDDQVSLDSLTYLYICHDRLLKSSKQIPLRKSSESMQLG